MAQKATLQVFRFDPDKDVGHYYQTFEVPWEKGLTVGSRRASLWPGDGSPFTRR